ncbi:MAG: hypothetical protein FJW14_10015 [Acidimicrobiia bacterium]|nr:hypothetical protein [Acidimicrobiia bacterium]
MSTRLIVGLALAVALIAPAVARAHGGHTHKVMGTVQSVKGDHVEVKGTDGKVVMIMLDGKTAITRGKTKLDAAALKVGERVSVDYMQDKSMNMATAVKLGTAPAVAAK